MQEAVRRAFRVALDRAAGPGAPRRLARHLPGGDGARADRARAPTGRCRCPTAPPADLDARCALLAQAERPLFVVGGGVLREGAHGAMQRLADASGIPVATLQYYPDAFPTTHPLALGPLGRNGWSSANRAVPQADVIIAIGAHIDVFSTTFRYGIISRDAKLIHHSTGRRATSASCSRSRWRWRARRAASSRG